MSHESESLLIKTIAELATENIALSENLTRTQQRCTELMNEVRDYKRRVDCAAESMMSMNEFILKVGEAFDQAEIDSERLAERYGIQEVATAAE